MSLEELADHCGRAVSSLGALLADFSASGIDKMAKRAMLISYWVGTYTKYLREEDSFSPQSVFRLKRGAIVRVEFGYRIGRELGGRHYAVVLDNNNSINRNIKADLYYLPTLSLVKEVAERKLAGENSNQLALHFHKGLACMIVSACEKAKEETGIDTVALSGGVYQNRLLLDYSVTMLEKRGFHVLRHHLLPPNDGGISLGQAVAAMRSMCVQKGE